MLLLVLKMGFQLKMVSFCIQKSLLLLLLPLLCSSQEINVERVDTHMINKDNIIKMDHKLLFNITIHGFLLWASMGFFMPIGILTIRMSNREECGRRLRVLFQIHLISQALAVLLATAGAVLSIKNFNNTFNNNHQRIGVALYGIIWLQVIIGFFRPNRGAKGRSVWFFAHWILGTTVSLLGVFSIYSGLQAFHEKTSKKVGIWTSLFTAQISFICLFYLFQDKWSYIQKQGVILGTTTDPMPEAPPKEKQKELAMESC
ncbi:cytochrome b561 domain-containing protein At2g30890-like [Humulus lupulus]|uniref:cytochrome b561 domain-containing protein At2g30890-like n=1 Tax=Humulus lupulus TaxID=3486 RepID=UPI002B40CF58|nr:cytochrome b561 domain-containing protein At2g30890-like [Humulus lupulus]